MIFPVVVDATVKSVFAYLLVVDDVVVVSKIHHPSLTEDGAWVEEIWDYTSYKCSTKAVEYRKHCNDPANGASHAAGD
jgi:hypothetical protein